MPADDCRQTARNGPAYRAGCVPYRPFRAPFRISPAQRMQCQPMNRPPRLVCPLGFCSVRRPKSLPVIAAFIGRAKTRCNERDFELLMLLAIFDVIGDFDTPLRE